MLRQLLLTLKLGKFTLLVFPFIGIRKWTLPFGDGFPSRQPVNLRIDRSHVPLVIG
jgi:hypothetical protein